MIWYILLGLYVLGGLAIVIYMAWPSVFGGYMGPSDWDVLFGALLVAVMWPIVLPWAWWDGRPRPNTYAVGSKKLKRFMEENNA